MIVWLQNKSFLTYIGTTIGFCCQTLHQFWCETFTVIHCLTDHIRLLAFAAKLCTSSGVKRLRWLPDRLPTTTGFCCETLHQFWRETFAMIAWLTTYDYWLLLRNFAPVLVWNFYGDCLTDYLWLLAFAPKLLWWLSDCQDDKLLPVRRKILQEHVISLALKSKLLP